LLTSIILLAAASASTPAPAEYKHYEFDSAKEEVVQIKGDAEYNFRPSSITVSSHLPQNEPVLRRLNSNMSPMVRARDFFALDTYPVTAFAKMFRLNAAGTKTDTACTAQFVGARYLVTAAHCLYDHTAGSFRAGFSIAANYDAGTSGDGLSEVTVTDAWISQRAIDDLTSLSSGKCEDVALVKIAEPLGEKTGWLGIRTATDEELESGLLLHNFFYPHVAGSQKLREQEKVFQAQDANNPQVQAVLKALADRIASSEKSEPLFSQNDLYYEFGSADKIDPASFAWKSEYSLAGASGSAYIDKSANIIGLVSRGDGEYGYNCRFTPASLAEFSAIIQNMNSRSNGLTYGAAE